MLGYDKKLLSRIKDNWLFLMILLIIEKNKFFTISLVDKPKGIVACFWLF